jgi:hypothetical protein
VSDDILLCSTPQNAERGRVEGKNLRELVRKIRGILLLEYESRISTLCVVNPLSDRKRPAGSGLEDGLIEHSTRARIHEHLMR